MSVAPPLEKNAKVQSQFAQCQQFLGQMRSNQVMGSQSLVLGIILHAGVSVSGLWKSRSPASRPSIPLKIGTEQVLVDMFNIYLLDLRTSTYEWLREAENQNPGKVSFLRKKSTFNTKIFITHQGVPESL